jgi:UDP-N-acetylmuramoyl-tripeptide--D-alanyl-D-alanine ligase
MNLTVEFVLNSVGGKLLRPGDNKEIGSVSTDSRQIKEGDLFIALRGENFDGHDFLPEVVARGAAGVIIDDQSKISMLSYSGPIILVEDCLDALQKLAGSYRKLFHIPVVAITGSVGKTTTKDMLAGCLKPLYRTLKTPGNYNNEIGLPLTLLHMGPHDQAAVVELAMRAAGEISQLASLVKPTYAIITNVEPVHLETMGSLENIARAKCELLKYVEPDGLAIINGDNRILLEEACQYPCRQLTFGYQPECDIQILAVGKVNHGIEVSLRLMAVRECFYLPVPAPQLAGNLAAAAAMAFLLGVDIMDIKACLAEYHPSGNRLNIVHLPEGGIIINDTYNANPVSMQAALEVCRDLAGSGRTVAVLGDMLELGEYEREGHIEVGRKVAGLGINLLVAIGSRAEYIVQGAQESGMSADKIRHFTDQEECLNWLRSNVSRQETVLFKASRGMQLEKLVQGWTA